jgi:Cu/Ag efflux pump CusA
MFKGLLAFGLTRQPIILLGLLIFIGGGLIAFTRLNIEAYPNPAPVILEITAQAPGLSAEPQIQGSSLVGEVYRYQVVAPPHFGLSNLRTVQGWIVQRRTVEGVVQVNTWGGTTKQYEVEVELQKLDAYNVTLPQVISAIGNANINVGGARSALASSPSTFVVSA